MLFRSEPSVSLCVAKTSSRRFGTLVWQATRRGLDKLASFLRLTRSASTNWSTILSAKRGFSRGLGPFPLPYWAFDLGDPAIDTRVAAWEESLLDHSEFDTPGTARRRWAEALVERYSGMQTESEWSSDPIVSRMKPAIAESLRKDMFRMGLDAWEKSPRRLLAMSDATQIAFVNPQSIPGGEPKFVFCRSWASGLGGGTSPTRGGS